MLRDIFESINLTKEKCTKNFNSENNNVGWIYKKSYMFIFKYNQLFGYDYI